MNKVRRPAAPSRAEGSVEAGLFKALAHPARIRILRRLRREECCVSEAESVLGLSQPNVSQHLKILKDAGVIAGRRSGTKICYRLTDDRIGRILDLIEPQETPREKRR
jgi:ArsR family transcriptional regulator, zinc-responsive transcriptional repressor